MLNLIENTVTKIDELIKEHLPESKYQFELYDLTTDTRHFRGYDEPFHWASVYKLFLVAEIIKMAEDGVLNLDDQIMLHKDLYTRGSCVTRYLTYLDELTYLDACKMAIATSDALCADELLAVVGINRFNELFNKANCTSSNLYWNLNDLMAKVLVAAKVDIRKGHFLGTEEFFSVYKTTFDEILQKNYTHVKDLNNCWHFILNVYLNEKYAEVFKECFQLNNVYSRLTPYTEFSKFGLFGKTGQLFLSIVNNEIGAITNKYTKTIYGYFSILTKDNRVRFFQSCDAFALIGLELAGLYEKLYETKLI